MYKVRNILIIVVCILTLVVFFYVDYSDLSWSNNRGNYVGIINGLLLIVLNVAGIRHEKVNLFDSIN